MIIGVDGNEANVQNRVGSGQYTYELLKQFSKNTTHFFEIFLKDKPLGSLPKETKNFNYKVFGPKIFWTQFALPINLTVGKKPDVFFSPAHYGPRFSGVPYVVTIHDLSYIHFPELFNKNDLYQLTNWSKYSVEKSSHIIVPSQSTKDDVVKNYHVTASKISVTYEGFDKSRFKPQTKSKVDQIKKTYKIKGDYIIFVGTLQPRKNLERLIEAFASTIGNYKRIQGNENSSAINNKARGTRLPLETFVKRGDTLSPRGILSLVIAGKRGWLYDSIFEKSKKLGIQSHVIFTDFVPDIDLPALISGAKVYVNPSLWEGFGIPVIEAQACGLPVVVSNTSSLPEIVGDSAILVDPESVDSIASGLQNVLSDEKTRSDLVKKGFENIKRFAWETCAKETLAVLEKVASK